MRGNVRSQVRALWTLSDINQIGNSRDTLKQEARERGLQGSHEIARHTGITSYNTADAYINTWRQVGEFARVEYGIKDMEKLTPEIIEGFLIVKAEGHVSWQTLTGHAAACNKLAVALSQYSENIAGKFDREAQIYNFKEVIDNVRDAYRNELDRFTDSRRYKDPQALIEAISDSRHQLAASIQHESGVRITEMSLRKPEQLKGYAIDRHTGKEIAQFSFQGKGGYRNNANLDRATYKNLEAQIKEHGEFRIDQGGYRESLKAAAVKTGLDYTGSHGLRWSFTSERYAELQEAGMKHETALATVSEELSHHRISITEHYLR